MTVCHARGCMVGCMGRISHKNLKIHIVISEIATSKNHIERLVPVRSETGFVILGKFWSKNDLRQHRNWKFWVDYQGCLRKRTDSELDLSIKNHRFSHGFSTVKKCRCRHVSATSRLTSTRLTRLEFLNRRAADAAPPLPSHHAYCTYKWKEKTYIKTVIFRLKIHFFSFFLYFRI